MCVPVRDTRYHPPLHRCSKLECSTTKRLEYKTNDTVGLRKALDEPFPTPPFSTLSRLVALEFIPEGFEVWSRGGVISCATNCTHLTMWWYATTRVVTRPRPAEGTGFLTLQRIGSGVEGLVRVVVICFQRRTPVRGASRMKCSEF